MILYEEILKEAPILRQLIENKIESEKGPMQSEINGLKTVVEDLTATILMGGF